MECFFSRRAFNARTGRFSHNPAEITRYVGINDTSGSAKKGHLLSADDWADEVVRQSANEHVLIYVHGFNTAQSDFLSRMIKIRKGCATAGFDGAVIGYDWPSDGKMLRYSHDRADAKKTARFLVLDGIALLREKKPNLKIHVLAHSMGTYLTVRGFAEVGNSGAPGTFKGHIDQAFFVAADIDQDWIVSGAWASLVMEQRCRQLTHYHSQEDDVLDISGQIINFGTKRSGRHGINPGLPATFKDVATADRYMDIHPPNKRTTRFSHTWYFDDDAFYRDIVGTLSGTKAEDLPTREPHTGGDQRLRF